MSTLNNGNSGNNGNFGNTGLSALIKAAREQGDGALPVEKWHPEHCGDMDLVIRKDGSWWHEGARITRAPLVKLFSRVLRKDVDGETYLVTPVEQIRITVECAHFLAVRVDIEGSGKHQRLFLTTNMDEVIEVGAKHPLIVETDTKTLEPTPLLRVRGRLDALIIRSVFYELVECAVEVDNRLGVYAGGGFFPLGPKGIHDV
ncbi:MAG: DUF1285 domain-containing protein [Robiginitomaculum sp.]|nr:DUF1285 domain-containing protein [Robiginitomaculum sp.]